jgi:myo-inositol-1-phosphate synthase
VQYTADYITSKYLYEKNHVDMDGQKVIITPQKHEYTFRTARKVPRVGVMLVGWGGNNGSTVTAAIHANKNNITWMRKEGRQTPNYFGSLTQATTIRIGSNQHGKEVHIPFKNILPMASPNDLVRTEQQRQTTGSRGATKLKRTLTNACLCFLFVRLIVSLAGR